MQSETRFKLWWHLVGSAIEHAASQHAQHVEALTFDLNTDCPPCSISFRQLFQEGESQEEQTSSLVTVLETLHSKWPGGFKASNVAIYTGMADEAAIGFKSALEEATGKALKVITAVTITWRLKAIVDAPVVIGGRTMVLRAWADNSKTAAISESRRSVDERILRILNAHLRGRRHYFSGQVAEDAYQYNLAPNS